MGELMKFDPAEVAKKAKDYKIDLPPEAAARYAGRPVLIATSVINDKFDDVAKRLPPSLNARKKRFKSDARGRPCRRRAASSRRVFERRGRRQERGDPAEGVRRHRSVLEPKKAEPTLWAANAKKEAEAVQAAIAAGKWDDAKTHAATVAQACGQCHGVYRERFDDGSFRIKK